MSSLGQQNGAVGKARERKGSGLCACVLSRLRWHLSLGLIVVNLLIPKAAVAQDSAGEYELKAAMLFNLTRFVEWPASAYADAQAPTLLCILGRDPFGNSLAALASNAPGSSRPVRVRRVQESKEIRGCHVVYISSSERKGIAQILSTLKGASVLTVGEMAQFAARGGMIQFSLEEKQVRVEVNLEAASEGDLKISSRLLLLARIVKGQNRNPSKEGSTLWSPAGFAVANTWSPRNESGLERNLLGTAFPSDTGLEPCRSR